MLLAHTTVPHQAALVCANFEKAALHPHIVVANKGESTKLKTRFSAESGSFVKGVPEGWIALGRSSYPNLICPRSL